MTTGAPLYLVTACSSPEEFVAAFRRYTDRTGLFVPCATPLPAGKRGRIAVTLRDGGVMLEGEVDVVSSSNKPSALYGRTGMTLRFVEPDEPSKTLLGELERARIALKPVQPTIGPRAADVPATPRPTAPAPGGRIDAANALAETVAIGDVARLRDVSGSSSAGIALGAAGAPSGGAVSTVSSASDSGKLGAAGASPPKAAQKFVMPAIPGKPGTKPPPLADPKPAEPRLDVRLAEAKPTATPLAEAASRASDAAKAAAEAARRAADAAKAAADAAEAARPAARPAPKPVADTPSAPTAAPAALAPKPVADKPSAPAAAKQTPVAPAPVVPARKAFVDAKTLPATDAELAQPAQAAQPAQPKPPPAKSVTATQPSAVVPPPAKPRPGPPAAAKPKPMLTVVEPEETTDLSEIPLSAEPFTPFDAPSDAIPEPAHADTRKTSLGMSAVLVLPAPVERRAPKTTEPPAPDAPRDTAVMDAEPGGVVGPASVDAHGETLPPGAMSFDMLAAATGLQGDWTMAPDEETPVPLVATTPPALEPPAPPLAPPAPLSGDWIMSTDAGAQDGWSAPSKVQKRAATNAGVGPPLLEVASDKPLSSEPKKEPAREDTGPKVQIDPTLIEALPDLERLEAAASGGLVPPGPISSPLIAPPPPPEDAPPMMPPPPMMPMPMPMMMPMAPPPMMPMAPPPMMPMAPPPNDFSVDVAFGQTGAALQPYGVMQQQQQLPMMPNPAGLVTTPGVGPAGQLGMMPQPGMMPPQPQMAPPYGMIMNPAGLATTPGVGPPGMIPGVDPSGMPIPPGTVPTNMSPLGGMVPLPPPAGAPQSFTPLPGFAPPVSAAFVVPDDPAQAAMPSAVQLATGDSTAVLHSRRRWIVAAVVLVLLAIAGGVYLVMTTGGGHGDGAVTPAPGSAAAIKPPADHAGSAHAGSGAALAPTPTAQDIDAAVAPTPGSATAVTPPAPGSAASDGTCQVKVFSVPTGADVSIGEKVVGKTPGTVDLPCNVEAKLIFRKAPFLAQYRAVKPTVDGDNTARVVLVRAQLQLKVSSSPVGAAITINGKAAGVTPSSVRVNAFEPSTIVLAKPGFEPYSEKLTPKTNGETVHGVLKRAKR